MMAVLTSLELWVGLGVFALMAVLLLGDGSGKKKRAARLDRVTRKQAPRASTATANTLRRKDPNEGSRLGKALANFSSIEKLQQRLIIAGMETSPKKFLGIVLAIALGTVMFLSLLGKPLLFSLLIGAVLGLGLPHLAVNRKIKKRKQLFLKQFPEAIDLIVRGLRAGLPVAESFQVVAKEIPAPVGETFAIVSQQTQLGLPMERALSDTAERLGLTEFDFFVTTIILQRETGGNLGEILNNLADMLRQRQMMKLKIGALSSEARASAYIVGALPFFVFGILYYLSPDYLAPLFDDFRGNMSLLGAGLMMVVGGFIMKKMTELEI